MASTYTITDVTITLAGVADGEGRSADQISNTGKKKELVVEWQVENGDPAPTLDALFKLYLVRQDGEAPAHSDAQVGTADADLLTEPKNAILIDTIAAIATVDIKQSSSCSFLGPGDRFNFVLWNASGADMSGDEADSFIRYFWLDE